MFILSEEKLLRFLHEISLGFETRPRDVLFFHLLVFGCLGLLALAALVQSRRGVRIRELGLEASFNRLARQKALRRSDLRIVEALSFYLAPAFDKLSLLRSRAVFDACIRRAVLEGAVPSVLASALRRKLGFGLSYTSGKPVSSMDLPDGLALRISASVGGSRGSRTAGTCDPPRFEEPLQGRVYRNDGERILVELEGPAVHGPRGRGCASLPTGTRVRVCFQNGFGLFVFPSVVTEGGRGTIALSHCREVRRIQRRRYYRKKLARTVYMKVPGAGEKLVRSTLVDLGGGGASVRAPADRYDVSTRLDLTLFVTGGNRFDLPASVVRFNPERGTLHLSFDSIPDSTRDRVIGYLFRCSD